MNPAALIQKRGRVLGSLTKMSTFIESIDRQTNEEIEARLNKLDSYWIEFCNLEDELLLIPEQVSKSDEFESKFFNIQATMTRELNKRKPKIVNPVDDDLNATINNMYSQQRAYFETLQEKSTVLDKAIKLPRVNIPPFNGEYTQWPSFKDLYEAAVHNNESIPPVHKFQLLKGLLQGNAARIIKHFLVTAANYEEAWDKLQKRYDNKRAIVNSIVQTFFEQPSVNKSSHMLLRSLAETSDELLRGLKALGPECESREPWLLHLLSAKLDDETKQQWAIHSVDMELPTVDSFLDFLHRRCDALESCNVTIKPATKHLQKQTYMATTKIECLCCKKTHPLHRCYKFQNFTVDRRNNFVSNHKICVNCLKGGHNANNCQSSNTCFKCKAKHHTLLHDVNNTKNSNSMMSANTSNSIISAGTSSSTGTTEAGSSRVNYQTTKTTNWDSKQSVLPTVVIVTQDTQGQTYMVRALLDSGSESTFITDTLTRKLGLKRRHAQLSVNGLSAISAGKTRGLVIIQLKSRHQKQNSITVNAFILDNLTSYLPSRTILLDNQDTRQLSEFHLADPEFYKSSQIEMILGVDVYYDIIKERRVMLKPNLHLIDSLFGWVVAGVVDQQPNSTTTCYNIRVSNDTVGNLLQRFWEVEENTFQVPTEDDISEIHFIKTHDFSNGRYVVELPFKENHSNLGSTLKQAQARMIAMEKKFCKDPILKVEYIKFMREYEKLGHMERIRTHDQFNKEEPINYLPHHAVMKRNHNISKLRVVFDGSCKSSSGLSLNDILRTGPTIQDDLFSILTRFRKHKIAIVSDIEKMYRQIRVSAKHQNYQRIVWRESPLQKFQHYKLTTVTYGLTCSAYLAIRALQQTTSNNKEISPQLSRTIKHDFYVDDLLTGCDSADEAITLYNNISSTLSQAGFTLRKWSSNCTKFLSFIPKERHGDEVVPIEDTESYIKTLGICWVSKEDNFTFNVPKMNNKQMTKRGLLSECGKLFDPLGWLSPITITFKIILQSLWLSKLEWDDLLPEEILQNWHNIQDELQSITAVRIPRYLEISGCYSIQYHGFCDASEKAYSAVVYSRVVNYSGSIVVRLIAAKTKVSPLKQISIPRLELCGAVLLTKLISKIADIFNVNAEELYMWTDSTIVLAWLSDVPRKWNCFVANRTSFIMDKLPNCHWRHVPTSINPADCASRGLAPKQFIKHNLWWNGPDYLQKPEHEWPISKYDRTKLTDLEKRNTVLISIRDTTELNTNTTFIKDIIDKYSSYMTIIRVISNCYKFAEICRKQKVPYITKEQLQKSENIILKWVQNQVFRDEIHQLQLSNHVKRSSKLISLNPFIDENGILRVGGRLHNSHLSFFRKHPVILPKHHELTEKLIRYLHIKHLHPNPSALLFITRLKYWIVGAKDIIRRASKNCVNCIRTQPRSSEQIMGNLPTSRVTLVRPFTNVGVDYAGPITISSKRGRGAKRLKSYICLFVCMATKAIHVELVGDLSTDAFIGALKRFTGRRGLPINIYSDNATNFIGARRKFDEFFTKITSKSHNETVAAYLGTFKINWHTIPPSAPHFGGLWEAGVKSIKTHLRRVLGEAAPTAEEIQTLLVQIEAVVNSRPLTPLNEDTDDLNILTPGHFLIGSSMLEVPDTNQNGVTLKLGERWELVQNMLRGFWKRWHSEYLTMLQKRSKWQHQQQNFREGELVIIKDDNSSPLIWARGRVIKIHPGSDGNVRVVTLKTRNGELKRPITKLCKLPPQ